MKGKKKTKMLQKKITYNKGKYQSREKKRKKKKIQRKKKEKYTDRENDH